MTSQPETAQALADRLEQELRELQPRVERLEADLEPDPDEYDEIAGELERIERELLAAIR